MSNFTSHVVVAILVFASWISYSHTQSNLNPAITWAVRLLDESRNSDYLDDPETARTLVESMGFHYLYPLRIGNSRGYHVIEEVMVWVPVELFAQTRLDNHPDSSSSSLSSSSSSVSLSRTHQPIQKRSLVHQESILEKSKFVKWFERQIPRTRRRRGWKDRYNDPLLPESWFLVNVIKRPLHWD
jgi:hypothetical protein